jgi:hypothetical protein
MFGVEADALTKVQLQAGMMNVVMRALERNTAAMPEIAGTAAQRWAALDVTFKNVKDQIGVSLLPALEGLMTGVEGLANRFLPPLVDWFGRLGEKLAPVTEAFGRFITEISTEGYDKVESFKNLLWSLLPTNLAKGAVGATEWVEGLVGAVQGGDWGEAGGMIWDQIVAGFTKAVDFGTMIDEALGASNYTFTAAGLVKTNKWADMAEGIMLQIVTGLANASGKLLDWLNTDQMIAAMNSAGLAIGRAVGGFIATFFATPGTTEETETGSEIEKMMARVRDNISAALQQIGREMGNYILAGIIEGITGKTPTAVVEGAIANAQAKPPSWYYQFWDAYESWYNSLPDWMTGSVTGQPMQVPYASQGIGATGPRAEDAYNFDSGAGAMGIPGATRTVSYGAPLLTSADIIDLSGVPDLVDALTVEVNRRRRAGENEDGLRADAPVRDINLTVYTQSARPEDVQIGVLRGLRAAGVMY